jgi:hypothetical protein
VLAAETRLDVARLVETGLAAAETERIGVPGSALAGSPGIV